ncbi:MAG: cytosol nonspecific dipeptidase [Bacteroidetes bacterium HGW-Bacteroidetes-4]|jgi:dipeptidase D|nr:MAG: cytosol nonspecific dipeptidase [Bacteroidetes bacterium HGW-Bacteroidetes-4]
MSVFQGLEPKDVWHYFGEICQVPRPSKKEEKIIAYLMDFGKKHNLDTKTDAAGNVLISKPATKGFENKKPVVLQSHMDMVCEKNSETKHDFFKDPIIPKVEGDWVKAAGTTLGADDGIGMAAQMAILASNSIEHPALECLFTVDEETGLTGAFALEKDFIKGRILLNLDSEDEGELFIGCAGGVDTIATYNFRTRPVPPKSIAFKLCVKGLRGGHSGDDIHKGYGNSNKIINRFLWMATQKYNIRVNKIEGGNLRNAIPREAFAIVTVKEKYVVDFEKDFSNYCKMIFKEYKGVETKMTFDLNKVEMPRFVMKMKDQWSLLDSLYACPHGVIAMSRDLPGLVETSTNLASVKFFEGNLIEVVTSQRSSVDSAKTDIANRVASVFHLAGAQVQHSDGYPGWNPNKDSEILKVSEESYERLFGRKPIVRAIHAGLECGLFLEKYPDMDMVSFGPTLRNVHSPDEKIHIGTVEKFWNHLLDVLKNIPNK